MLKNKGFEGRFDNQDGINQIIVAEDWRAWWKEGQEDGRKNSRPEYKPAAPYANRIRSGENSQQWFSWSAYHDAGIYQVVDDFTPGDKVVFSAWVQVWAVNKNNRPAHNNIEIWLGVDQGGLTDPFSDEVIWTDPIRPNHEEWMLFETEEIEVSRYATFFVRSRPQWPVRDNNVYVDDVDVVIGNAEPPNSPSVDYGYIRRIVREELDKSRIAS